MDNIKRCSESIYTNNYKIRTLCIIHLYKKYFGKGVIIGTIKDRN